MYVVPLFSNHVHAIMETRQLSSLSTQQIHVPTLNINQLNSYELISSKWLVENDVLFPPVCNIQGQLIIEDTWNIKSTPFEQSPIHHSTSMILNDSLFSNTRLENTIHIQTIQTDMLNASAINIIDDVTISTCDNVPPHIHGTIISNNTFIDGTLTLDQSSFVNLLLLDESLEVIKDALIDGDLWTGGDLFVNDFNTQGNSTFEKNVMTMDELNIKTLQVIKDAYFMQNVYIEDFLLVKNMHIAEALDWQPKSVVINNVLNVSNIHVKQGIIVEDQCILGRMLLNKSDTSLKTRMMHIKNQDLSLKNARLTIEQYRGDHALMRDNNGPRAMMVCRTNAQNKMSRILMVNNARRLAKKFSMVWTRPSLPQYDYQADKLLRIDSNESPMGENDLIDMYMKYSKDKTSFCFDSGMAFNGSNRTICQYDNTSQSIVFDNDLNKRAPGITTHAINFYPIYITPVESSSSHSGHDMSNTPNLATIDQNCNNKYTHVVFDMKTCTYQVKNMHLNQSMQPSAILLTQMCDIKNDECVTLESANLTSYASNLHAFQLDSSCPTFNNTEEMIEDAQDLVSDDLIQYNDVHTTYLCDDIDEADYVHTKKLSEHMFNVRYDTQPNVCEGHDWVETTKFVQEHIPIVEEGVLWYKGNDNRLHLDTRGPLANFSDFRTFTAGTFVINVSNRSLGLLLDTGPNSRIFGHYVGNTVLLTISYSFILLIKDVNLRTLIGNTRIEFPPELRLLPTKHDQASPFTILNVPPNNDNDIDGSISINTHLENEPPHVAEMSIILTRQGRGNISRNRHFLIISFSKTLYREW